MQDSKSFLNRIRLHYELYSFSCQQLDSNNKQDIAEHPENIGDDKRLIK